MCVLAEQMEGAKKNLITNIGGKNTERDLWLTTLLEHTEKALEDHKKGCEECRA